jgi:hypothetical protein
MEPEPPQPAPPPPPAPAPQPPIAEAPLPGPEPEPQLVEAPPPKAAEPPPPAPKPEPPQPRRGVKHRPQPKAGREPVPVPAGQMIYDSLKTSFVDFPRLMSTLEKEGYTGYIRLLTDDVHGLIFFRDGSALECVYDSGSGPESQFGNDALVAFNDEVTSGRGVLDVVALSPELVNGLHELSVAKPMYTELYASWVDMHSLLRFLSERSLSGSVMVRATEATGVIILTKGEVTGAYTSQSRDISPDPNLVLELCADGSAMIEVKSAAETEHRPLDVDAVVGPKKPATRAPAAPPAPAPAPAPPPAPAAAAPAPPSEPAAEAAPVGDTQSLPAAAFQTMQIEAAIRAVQPPAAPQRPEPLPPEPQAAPEPVVLQLDWEQVVQDLQTMADEALGNRARKVKDILAGAERSQAGVEGAIAQIPNISLLFVDSSRLEALAKDMQAKLQSYR